MKRRSKLDSQIIAHLRQNDQQRQTLWDHLLETSRIAGELSGKIGLKQAGEILGLLHDLGKASAEFQKYIASANGLIDPDSDDYIDAAAHKGEIDHSSAGSQILYQYWIKQAPKELAAAQILSLCIASHHSGLIDCLAPGGENKFSRRMEKPEEKTHAQESLAAFGPDEMKTLNRLLSQDVGKSISEKLLLLKESNDSSETMTFKCGLLIRFLYSCLIDADRLSTANFETPGHASLRNAGRRPPWEMLIQRLDAKIKDFEAKESRNKVDEIRQQISQECLLFSTKPKGVFQLKVPTGGGKTLGSLRFALNHAAHHGLDRIFYIIPYTSIIDQNADEVRKILEDRDSKGNLQDAIVLEHHSNLTPEEETRRQHLLAENWDAPIVFTTQVQFLETLFGAGTRGVRRMHQLANAVIIFDEVQTIPVRCIHLFNVALRFLIQGCGSTVVLCTATQPLLDKVEPVQRALPVHPDYRIISNEYDLFASLKRVAVFDRRKTEGWKDEELADLTEQELLQKGSVLLITNTKSAARSLYKTIIGRRIAATYHLSTNMCPAHRLAVLAEVKEKLRQGQQVICVSTQLIEAGVDIDFGSVIRYLAGLDSVTQAAGRCNRHGIREIGNVLIVNPISENIEPLKDIAIGKEMAERVLSEFHQNPQAFLNDPLGLDMINRYYEYYFYRRSSEMCYWVDERSPVGQTDNLFNLLSTNSIAVSAYQRVNQSMPPLAFKQSFQSAAKAFQAIDSPTRGVVVPYTMEGEEIINRLCSAFEIEKQFRLLKQAQRYSVNLFPYEFKKMADQKAIHEVQEGAGIFYLNRPYYSDAFGWQDEAASGMETLII